MASFVTFWNGVNFTIFSNNMAQSFSNKNSSFAAILNLWSNYLQNEPEKYYEVILKHATVDKNYKIQLEMVCHCRVYIWIDEMSLHRLI